MNEDRDDKPERCRHRDFWLLVLRNGSQATWCYRCGALRMLGEKRWTKPVGPTGENPALAALDKEPAR